MLQKPASNQHVITNTCKCIQIDRKKRVSVLLFILTIALTVFQAFVQLPGAKRFAKL